MPGCNVCYGSRAHLKRHHNARHANLTFEEKDETVNLQRLLTFLLRGGALGDGINYASEPPNSNGGTGNPWTEGLHLTADNPSQRTTRGDSIERTSVALAPTPLRRSIRTGGLILGSRAFEPQFDGSYAAPAPVTGMTPPSEMSPYWPAATLGQFTDPSGYGQFRPQSRAQAERHIHARPALHGQGRASHNNSHFSPGHVGYGNTQPVPTTNILYNYGNGHHTALGPYLDEDDEAQSGANDAGCDYMGPPY